MLHYNLMRQKYSKPSKVEVDENVENERRQVLTKITISTFNFHVGRSKISVICPSTLYKTLICYMARMNTTGLTMRRTYTQRFNFDTVTAVDLTTMTTRYEQRLLTRFCKL